MEETINRFAIAKKSFENSVYCGDACACWRHNGKIVLLVVDGLGHGKEAETAAKAAVEYVSMNVSDSIQELFSGCDAAIRHTRGAAMGLTVVDTAEETITCAGIGNTRALMMNDNTIRFSGNYGIVGAGFRKLIPETRPIRKGSLIILFTDGVEEMIDLFEYSGDVISNPDILAHRIISDWGRDTDDASVLVYKYE